MREGEGHALLRQGFTGQAQKPQNKKPGIAPGSFSNLNTKISHLLKRILALLNHVVGHFASGFLQVVRIDFGEALEAHEHEA